MKISSTFIRASAIALVAVALVACSDAKSNDSLAQDTSLNKDLALANADTAVQPQLKDVPVETAPVAAPAAPQPSPRPRAATPPRAVVRTVQRPPEKVRTEPDPGAPVVTASGNTVTAEAKGSERALGTVSSGSEMSFYAGQRICTNTNQVGDRFTAQISDPVQGSNGAVIPAGSSAIVEVTSLKRSERANDNIEIALRVVSITFNGKTYPVTSEVSYAQVERVRGESNTTGDAVKGAAIGAVLGQILGHKTKSTVIGAAGGAVAGAAIGRANAKMDGCVPSGGRITVKLTQPLVVQLT
ncbi:MAG TPA: YMGG-like glycine zipper-containing protein [Gemmatimonadaceae bacterium]|nr:YMGG-like glycine zipper-containing protein [Gemmatimonadaceae bacterium]